MKKPVQHTILKNTLWLSGERYIYWEEEKALVLSDLHFGKTGHFRKEGIAMPQQVYKEDLQRLFSAIQCYQPQKLIVVGDLFHSKENKEMELFMRWRSDVSHISIHLIKGNHDILKNAWYEKADINTISFSTISNFIFVHDITTSGHDEQTTDYIFSGHIHPGIKIRNRLQSLCFPCFYFGEKYAVLPAFGNFTGISMIKPNKGETVYAIVNQNLVKGLV